MTIKPVWRRNQQTSSLVTGTKTHISTHASTEPNSVDAGNAVPLGGQAVSATASTGGAWRGWQDQAWQRWQTLSARDRMALSLLTLFLLLMVGGFGGYSLHQAAQKQQQAYERSVADYFWLRAQAGNLSTSTTTDSEQPLQMRLSTLLAQGGVSEVQVVPAGESVQLAFSHNSQAVVSQLLGQMQQQGMSIQRLSIVQDPTTRVINVQASIGL